MNAKQLERLLVSHGANASAFDVVTRKLREAFKLSTGGRGMNAHNLEVDEVAWLLAAYAGSEVASKADHTLRRLMDLMSHRTEPSNDFLASLQLILRGEIKGVREVRICRNLDLAVIVYEEGRVDKFLGYAEFDNPDGAGEASFRSEGILSGGLLESVAEAVAL